MLLAPLAFFVIFKYRPMTNIVMAFQDYNMFSKSIWDNPWATTGGELDLFKYFRQAFRSPEFIRVLGNTITLNFLDLVCGFAVPIFLAIMLNEVAFRRLKRITQTVLYLPYFLSWIIVAGLAFQILAPQTGVVNVLIKGAGGTPIPFLNNQTMWIVTYILVGIWHSSGYNSIVYLAAITSLNPELYEAAEVDGAGRLRRIWHITLPGIRPTIFVMLILQLGRILQIGRERPYAMINPLVRPVGDVISTYVYRVGVESMQFSLTTAVGLFQSVVCVIFLVAANVLTERMGERGIW
jgi:putative aldouronate transport system permease protein